MDRETALRMLLSIQRTAKNQEFFLTAKYQHESDEKLFSIIHELARDLAGMIRNAKNITD